MFCEATPVVKVLIQSRYKITEQKIRHKKSKLRKYVREQGSFLQTVYNRCSVVKKAELFPSALGRFSTATNYVTTN